jgi:hypothetical protein
MDSYLASNYEILIKTESFIKFKKKLFKDFVDNNNDSEEFLRRKFYKILDCYLCNKEFNYKYFEGVDLKPILKELDNKFKKIKEGSFVVQGGNVGVMKDDNISWIRHNDKYSKDEITTFLK